jgi:hypothetical protein
MAETRITFRQLDEGLRNDLTTLAALAIRNEIVCEHFLEKLGISVDEIGAKARELDRRVRDSKELQRRFPVLFG